MGFYTGNNNQNNNFLTKFKDTFGSLFKTPSAAAQQQTIGGSSLANNPQNPYGTSQPANVFNGAYQVKAGDTFDNIAKQNNLTVPQVQQANNGMVVPPPKGSYINVPQYQSPTTVPTTYPSQNPYYGPAPTPFGNTPPNSAYQKADYTDIIQNQLAAGSPPATIPASLNIINPVTGQPATPDDLIASGYTLDHKTNTWHFGGAGNGTQTATGSGAFAGTQAAQYNAANNVAFTNQIRWYKGKKYTIGQLLRKGVLNIHSQDGKWHGKHGGGGSGKPKPAAPTDGTNAGTTAGTVLGLHLGGG